MALNKPKLIGIAAIVAVVAATWTYNAYEQWHLDYLYTNGKWLEFLRDAPRGDPAYELKRMSALAELAKGRCLVEVPRIKKELTLLQQQERWGEMLKVPEAQSCARFDSEIAAALKVAPGKMNEAKLGALYTERGGRTAFLKKAAQLERTKPKDAVILLKPLQGLGDAELEALAKTAHDHVISIERAENARTIAQAHAKELAGRKRQGVRIGMTEEEVLQSSWGRPQHINRTTTVGGTHEQWVYGIGNYLYFENGILTTIQN